MAPVPVFTSVHVSDRRGADPDQIRRVLREAGPAGLNNGLSDAENLRLATTPHIAELVALVLHGCARRFLPG